MSVSLIFPQLPFSLSICSVAAWYLDVAVSGLHVAVLVSSVAIPNSRWQILTLPGLAHIRLYILVIVSKFRISKIKCT